MDVGFLGLGAMGRPMAVNLAAAGNWVVGWNRSRVDAPAGVEVADSPADVARATAVTIIMVTDEPAVRAVLFADGGWATGAHAGDVVIQSSTIGPAATRAVARELAERDLRMVDAPVSGSVGPAAQGALTILAGEDEADLRTLQPVFEPLARAVVHCGPVGTGSAVKLAVNAVLVSALAAAGEALTWLVDSEPEVSLEEITPLFERVSPLVAKRAGVLVGQPPEGGFSLRQVTKDLDLIVGAMRPAEVLEAVQRAARAAADQGRRDQDVSALGAAARARRGW